MKIDTGKGYFFMLFQQRHAVFNLVIAFVACAIFLALIPFFGAIRAQAAFALLAILAIEPMLFRKRPGQVNFDERDRQIFLRATQLTFMVFWILLVAGVMSGYFVMKSRGTINVELLPLAVWLGMVALLVTHSTILLILYKKS